MFTLEYGLWSVATTPVVEAYNSTDRRAPPCNARDPV